MGACNTKVEEPPEEKKARLTDELSSTQVELNLVSQQVEELFHFKILLLGAGESGKSTVLKQMKLIHKSVPKQQELEMIAVSLHQNVVDCMKALINAVKGFQYYPNLSAEDQKTCEQLFSLDDGGKLTLEMAQQVLRLWQSEPVQQAYARRDEFWLLDSITYYLDQANLMRFCEPNFLPNEEDIIMARIRTTGIVVTELKNFVSTGLDEKSDIGHKIEVTFQVVDVGGQKNERKKWIHCFDDVKCILFIDNLAGVNQVLFEDQSKNRMHDSLELFGQITSNKAFQKTPIFLFLNKKDLFESLVQRWDMKKTFPDYEGGHSLENALKFIHSKFESKLPQDKYVKILEVTARMKRDIRTAFEEVKKALWEDRKGELLKQFRDLRKKQTELQNKVKTLSQQLGSAQ